MTKEHSNSKRLCQQVSALLTKGTYLNRQPFSVQFYEGSIRFMNESRRPSDRPRRYYKRGKVTEFTSRSRLRMMKLFSRIRYQDLSQPYFLTLTYHHAYKRAQNTHQKHRNVFLTALRREFPDSRYIWRLELQKRGAPHFHIMLWSTGHFNPMVQEKNQGRLRSIWHNIADPSSRIHEEHGFHCQPVTNRDQCFNYIKKYCSKVDIGMSEELEGRRWGASQKLPCEPYLDIELKYSTWQQVRTAISVHFANYKKLAWLRDELRDGHNNIEVFLPVGNAFELLVWCLQSVKNDPDVKILIELIEGFS